jgi:hypothetical protein
MWNLTQELSDIVTKDGWKCGQDLDLGALRSKIRCYLEVLARLPESIGRWDPNSSLTSGFSAMAMHLRVREFVVKKSVTKIHLPSYSRAILSVSEKKILKGQRFSDIPKIQYNVTTLLRSIPENYCQYCLRQRHHRLKSSFIWGIFQS